jgi:hypothetical protein
MRERMVDVEVVPELSAIKNPNEVLIEIFPRQALRVCHLGVLELNHDSKLGDDIGAVNLAIRRCVGNLAMDRRKQAFPLAVPLGFVLPPRIAILTSGMRPVKDDTRAAFRQGRRTA